MQVVGVAKSVVDIVRLIYIGRVAAVNNFDDVDMSFGLNFVDEGVLPMLAEEEHHERPENIHLQASKHSPQVLQYQIISCFEYLELQSIEVQEQDSLCS